MVNQINSNQTNRMAIVETFGETVDLLKRGSTDTVSKAIDLFSRIPQEERGGVYEELYHLVPFTQSYWGCAEDAFHDRNGQRSSPEVKAQAIQNYLIQSIASGKLNDPMAKNKAIHLLMNIVSEHMEKGAPNAMDLFSRMPKEARDGVYGQLYTLKPIANSYWGYAEDAFHNRNAQSSTQEQKVQAIQNYLVLNIIDLFLCNNEQNITHAMELFSRLPKNVRDGVYGQLYTLKTFQNDYYGCAEDAFHNRNGQGATNDEKLLSLQQYLIQSIPVTPEPKSNPIIPKPVPTPEELAEKQKNEHIRVLEQICAKNDNEYNFPTCKEPELKEGEFLIRRCKSYTDKNPLYTVVAKRKAFKNDHILVSFDVKTGNLSSGANYKSVDELIKSLDLLPQNQFYGFVQPLRVAAEPVMQIGEILYERDQAEELFGLGLRSIISQNFLSGLSHYKFGEIELGQKTYQPVNGGTQNFSKKRLASCGSSLTREIILLDPKDSPLLEEHFNQLRKILNANMTTEQVLMVVKHYVRNKIFPSCLNKKIDIVGEVDRMVEKARKTNPCATYTGNSSAKIPFMPIDDFIKTGIGVCRHHGLVTAYLLDRLLSEQNPIIEGTVQHIRGNLDSGGAHVWTTFIPKRKSNAPPEKWHLDTLWDDLINYAKDKRYLNLAYGPKMVQDQLNRTNGAAKINGQPEG